MVFLAKIKKIFPYCFLENHARISRILNHPCSFPLRNTTSANRIRITSFSLRSSATPLRIRLPVHFANFRQSPATEKHVRLFPHNLLRAVSGPATVFPGNLLSPTGIHLSCQRSWRLLFGCVACDSDKCDGTNHGDPVRVSDPLRLQKSVAVIRKRGSP